VTPARRQTDGERRPTGACALWVVARDFPHISKKAEAERRAGPPVWCDPRVPSSSSNLPRRPAVSLLPPHHTDRAPGRPRRTRSGTCAVMGCATSSQFGAARVMEPRRTRSGTCAVMGCATSSQFGEAHVMEPQVLASETSCEYTTYYYPLRARQQPRQLRLLCSAGPEAG